MDITVLPGKLSGQIQIIPSKSMAHRLLICAAFANSETTLICPETSRDIEATVVCLNSIGAKILPIPEGYSITPISEIPESAVLNCRESGSTLRFLLPIAGALGIRTTFHMEGRLPLRPLSPLWEEMERMGCSLTRPTNSTVRCEGKLQPGSYRIDGGVSSQFISGLLFAHSLIDGPCTLKVTGNPESTPYIDMTRSAMGLFGAPHYRTPGCIHVEGDWSSAAFFLAANYLGSRLDVRGLDPDSTQADRAVTQLLPIMADNPEIDGADIPDLVPILSVVAAALKGARFTNIRRLRLKESDRVEAICAMIHSLGGVAEATENTLTVHGTGLRGGIVDARNDHRIAMSAAIAATVSPEPVTVCGAEAVNKSYPKFWEEFRRLGGNYEQYIR